MGRMGQRVPPGGYRRFAQGDTLRAPTWRHPRIAIIDLPMEKVRDAARRLGLSLVER